MSNVQQKERKMKDQKGRCWKENEQKKQEMDEWKKKERKKKGTHKKKIFP